MFEIPTCAPLGTGMTVSPALRHGRILGDSDFNAGRPNGLTVREWRRIDYNGIPVLLTVEGKGGSG